MVLIEIDDKYYKKFISYCLEHCDEFSAMFEKEKEIYLLQDLVDLVQDIIIERKSLAIHPYTGVVFEDCDFISMKCCNRAGNILYRANNMSDWNGVCLPEELCFCRDGEVWFEYISHEKMCLVNIMTEEDRRIIEICGK